MPDAVLTDLQIALKRVIYERGQIDPAEVAIAYEAPIRSWVAARTGPTIDLFLYDLRENTELRKGGMETTKVNGRGLARMPPRRFDLSYLVSVLSTEVEDEHLVLWRVLLTLLKHPILPPELLPESLRKADLPITVKLELPDGSPKPLEIWGALDLPPRPSLSVVVTVPADLEVAFEAPLVLTRTARYRRFNDPEIPVDQRHHLGGFVKRRGGAPVVGAKVALAGSTQQVVTGESGEFAFTGILEEKVTLQVSHEKQERTVTFVLPADSYQIDLE